MTHIQCLQCRRHWFDSWAVKVCWRRDRLPTPIFLGFPCGSGGKEFTCNERDLGSIPGLRRSPGEGKGYLLQYTGLENPMDYIVQGSQRVGHARTTLMSFTSMFPQYPFWQQFVSWMDLHFIKCFFCIYWDYHVVSIFPFLDIVYHIDLYIDTFNILT